MLNLINALKLLIPLLIFSVLVSFSLSPKTKQSVLTTKQIPNCDSVPELNQHLISFVDSNMKKRVGSGQCWDLAEHALNKNNAKWNGLYKFGTEVNYQTDCIYPGDIMQFEGVLVKYVRDGGKWYEEMKHHTAFIYKVNGTGEFVLAHQNFGSFGKKVGLTTLDMKHVKKGRIKIFRPVK